MTMTLPHVFSRRTALTLTVAAGIGLFSSLAQAQPKLDVIYVPTPQPVVDRMLEMANVKSTDKVIDLGCGDGRMIVTAARKYGATGFGVDIDPNRIKEAKESAEKHGVTDKVEFKIGNLFDEGLRDSDVMTMYLLTDLNLRLRPKILAELKPGARVVSHAFHMGEWKADETDEVDNKDIYLWYVPAKVEGQWKVEGGQAMSLDLKQEFQMVTGKATLKSGEVADVTGRLKGTEITLSVNADGKKHELKGVVEGGEVKGAGGAWKAVKG